MNADNNVKTRTDNSGHTDVKASVTVETAMAFPLFFLFIWMIWQLFLTVLLELNMTRNVAKTVNEFAAAGYINRLTSEKDPRSSDALLEAMIYANNAAKIGDLWKTLSVECKVSEDDYIIEVNAEHVIEPMFFADFSLPFMQSYRIRENTGIWEANKPVSETKEKEEDKDHGEKVYVTENGKVYHRDLFCSYITVRAEAIDIEELQNRRNRDGKRYLECEYCRDAVRTGEVYITYFGTKYHYSSDCSGLKRCVREVELNEVEGMRPCSKCGGK